MGARARRGGREAAGSAATPGRAGETGAVRVGVDVGGTFTDVAIHDGTRLIVHKVLSTPGAPERAVLRGVRDCVAPGTTLRMSHGSTVATNAFLERKGQRAAFIATRGFEDLLFLGRQARPALYDLTPSARAPLLRASDALGAPERVGADGRIVCRLTWREARSLARRVARAGFRSAAVCLLFAFRRPDHERMLARALAAAGIDVHLSNEVLPHAGEFERASATYLNAYLSPRVRRYLDRLARWVGPDRLSIMQSSGGCCRAEAAGRMGITTILSGPAGGIVGAQIVAGRERRLVTFDMGGTSTDVSLVDGRPRVTRDYRIEGWPVGIPVIDIHTIGAGGGSIARADRGGVLRVGPESAGASPGPACYGRGKDFTVTDAHVVLGHIPAGTRLGGQVPIDPDRAHAAARRLGRALGLGVRETAQGVLDVVRSSMERAIRRVSVARGHDPAQFVLVSFGGAGGLSAFVLASALGMKKVLVPRYPGALSALGMLGADRIATSQQGIYTPWPKGRAALAALCRRLEPVLATLEARNAGALGPEWGADAPHSRIDRARGRHDGEIRSVPDRVARHWPGGALAGHRHAVSPPAVVERTLALAFTGRSEVIEVVWPPGAGALEQFHAEHRRAHGIDLAGSPVQIVAVGVRTIVAGCPGLVATHALPASPVGERGGRRGRDHVVAAGVRGAGSARGARTATASHALADLGAGPRRVAVLDRGALAAGDKVAGPAIIVDETATTLMPEGWLGRIDTHGHLWGEPAAARRARGPAR